MRVHHGRSQQGGNGHVRFGNLGRQIPPCVFHCHHLQGAAGGRIAGGQDWSQQEHPHQTDADWTGLAVARMGPEAAQVRVFARLAYHVGMSYAVP